MTETPSATEPLSFVHWSDPLCIWAFVAQARHERVLLDYGERIRVRHRVVPVFGSIVQKFRSGSWAEAGHAGRAAKTREIAERFGISDVDGSMWESDPPSSSWSPGMAVMAVRGMVERGEVSPDADRVYLEALRRAAFVDNRNTARRAVQLEVAESLDLDRGTIEADLDDGTALASLWEEHLDREADRVQGSPCYVFDGGREMLYGNVADTVIRATIDALLDGLEPGGSEC